MNNTELIKFLRQIVVIIAGKQSENIADLLYSTKHVNEFNIAKKLDLTINQTRNILYKIADFGIVSSIRKKDKKKGWYTYFWKIEVPKALEFLRDILVKNIEQLNSQIKSREEKQFYVCETCKTEYNEENALLRDFTCTECGNVFVLKDNAPVVREMKKQLQRIANELETVDAEISKDKEKDNKLKEKEKKKELKKKAEKKVSMKKDAERKKAHQKKPVPNVKKIPAKKKASVKTRKPGA